jgi:RNA polymerase sigma-70 factor (ECF subfamily)
VGKPENALDLTQEFFATFLEKRWIESADSGRGRFRTFLLVVLDRFLSDQHDRGKAAKRGGQRRILSLEVGTAEGLLASLWSLEEDPARAFTKQWAIAIIRECLDTLRAEMTTKEKALYYEVFVRFYGFDGKIGEGAYARLAQEFQLNEGDVTNYLHRARNAFRRILEEKVLESVSSPADVQAEIQGLFNSLSR